MQFPSFLSRKQRMKWKNSTTYSTFSWRVSNQFPLTEIFFDWVKLLLAIFVQIIDFCRAHVITDTAVKRIKCERYVDPSYSPPNDGDSNLNIFDYEWVLFQPYPRTVSARMKHFQNTKHSLLLCHSPDVEICSSDGDGEPFCFTFWSNDSKGIEVRRKVSFRSLFLKWLILFFIVCLVRNIEFSPY